MAIYNGKKLTKANTCPLGLYRLKDLPIGEYVRRIDRCKVCKGEGKPDDYAPPYDWNKDGVCAACEGKGYTKEYPTVYIRGGYDATERRYSLTRFDDVNSEVMKSGSVLVLAGFTF